MRRWSKWSEFLVEYVIDTCRSRGMHINLGDIVQTSDDLEFLENLAARLLRELKKRKPISDGYTNLYNLLIRLVRNLNVSPDIIERAWNLVCGIKLDRFYWLFEDFKKGVAGNEKTPPAILAELAADIISSKEIGGNFSVCERLLRNKSLPPDVFVSLARRIMDLGDSFPGAISLFQALLESPQVPPDLLGRLAGFRQEVRYGVARHPNTPQEVLARLAADEDSNIRSAVAGNPNAPLDVLRKLASDPSSIVRLEAAGNPSTPPDVLRKIYSRAMKYIDSGLKHDFLKLLAGNPSLPEDVLIALSFEKGDIGREAKKALARRGVS